MKTYLKDHWRSWLTYLVLFLIIMLAANAWKTRNAPDGNLSDFSGTTIDRTVISVAEFAGKPILFHFWATWCPVCELQKNNVQSIAENYPVITIASWSGGDTEVKAYMQEHELTFPVILDDNGELARSFGLQGVPASFILAPDGDIRFVESGYTTEPGLRLRLWLSTLW